MYRLLVRFFRLYGKGFRARFCWVCGLAVLAGLFETFGLLAIYPVLRILLEPEIVRQNEYLRLIYEFLGLSRPQYLAALFAAGIVVVFVLKNAYMLVYTRLQLNLIRDWKVGVRSQLMRYYIQSPYVLFLEQDSNIMMRNIDSFTLKAVNYVVFSVMNLFVNILIMLIIMLVLSVRYFVYLFSMIGATALLIYILHKLLRHKLYVLGKDEQKALIAERRVLGQCFSSIKETKVSNAERFFIEGFGAVNRGYMAVDSDILYYQRIAPFILEVVVIFCIMIMGAGVVASNQDSGSGIVASLGVLAAGAFRLAPLAARIVAALNSMSAGKAQLETIVKEAEMPGFFALQKLAPPQNIERLHLLRELRLENICFRYPKPNIRLNASAKAMSEAEPNLDALRDLNLCIRRGEFIGIVGASGAGKSTFADLLLGLLEPQQGQILIDGVALDAANVRGWRANIGYVPQSIVLIDSTIRQSVAFGVAEIDDQRVEAALKGACLWDFVQGLPDGIYGRIEEGGKNFSGGQRQRLAIARALYRSVEVLVLDEATSALDNTTEFAIAQAIEALRGECTILVIAHRLSTLKRCDRVLFFREGELVDSGSFAELSKHSDFKHMLEVSRIEV